MRILFSSVPAYGHLIPLNPLMRAAVAERHPVAVLTSGGMAQAIKEELPSAVEHLAVGPTVAEFVEETARRTGLDTIAPSPLAVGEMFGRTRLEQAIDDALAVVQAWQPDLIFADAYDTVGPMTAAALQVPWYQVGLGPAMPNAFHHEIEKAAASTYIAHNLTPTLPVSYLDPCPPALQNPEWIGKVPHQSLRPQAHERSTHTESLPSFADPGKPQILITFGTIFSDPDLLATVVEAVARHDANVLVTLGFSIRQSSQVDTVDKSNRDRLADTSHAAQVQYLPFTPISQLLDGTHIVVAAGGSGTVLAALSCAVPMVLLPQGADQTYIAARAEAAGVAIIVRDAAGIADAIATLLTDPRYRAAASEIAATIATMPNAQDVLAAIVQSA